MRHDAQYLSHESKTLSHEIKTLSHEKKILFMLKYHGHILGDLVHFL